ncbi:MAG TPA: GAF domain-containing protein, partial [Polyangiaceae bacterium]|nr:GAF domain-containing protein [Polyangiaceae bacterium]
PSLAEALSRLADERPAETWSMTDVEDALRGEVSGGGLAAAAERPQGEAALSELALALAHRPIDKRAVAVVERHALSLPTALRLAAADALRLAGELGRARALVAGLDRGGAIAADVLRRTGEHEEAEREARRALENEDPDGRARAVLGRCLFDRGALDEAAEVVGTHPRNAAVAEVAALIAHARGEDERAVELAERGVALANTPESRARCSGALGHVTRHRDPRAYLAAYRLAVVHAMEAGAVLEEASYRTGEAAALVDAGAVGEALETAERAAMLWDEVLARPEMAARAWLARAAAFATIDAGPETLHAADRAIRLATLAADVRAQAHACWAIADALPTGAPDAIRAAKRAVELSDDEDYDGDQSAARLWRHAPDALAEERRHAIDERCRHATASADLNVRLAWWGARAERLIDDVDGSDGQASEPRLVLAELIAMADADAPVGTHGKAMAAGCRLAAAMGATDSFARLDEAHRRHASQVLDGLRGELAAKARASAWLMRGHGNVARDSSRHERAIDLQGLVRALSERDELQTLLDRVVDVLLMWTGAERGLLLMPDDDGTLQPRSARNLARHDLRDEQLAMSSSLARRAMESGEPVVAVDAMAELSSSYDSVHALKLRSVLAVPLAARGEQLGCVYLDDRLRRGAFGDEQVAWARSVAPVAALAISDARMQATLKEAVERAERASRRLEELLAHKESELDVAQRRLADTDPGVERWGIVGDSDAMKRVLTLIARVARSDVPVLLRGESGSGKELVARAVHEASERAREPFVGENCGALPETLLESALFGHVKGAFTGADRPRLGLFEAADGGTLFLDEIGEMSLSMQTKLLRVLEDSVVRPVGSTRGKTVDVRILAATHRDLEQMVAEGTFREDLYYRLNVITIAIPPLRERPSDVPLLVRHLLDKHAPDRSVSLTKEAMRELTRFPWPGNVRQLENEIRRALLMADDVVDVEHLSLADGDSSPTPHPEMVLDIRTRIDQLEIQLVKQAMERTGDNQTQAAKLLGVSRYGLHKMMKRLGLKD